MSRCSSGPLNGLGLQYRADCRVRREISCRWARIISIGTGLTPAGFDARRERFMVTKTRLNDAGEVLDCAFVTGPTLHRWKVRHAKHPEIHALLRSWQLHPAHSGGVLLNRHTIKPGRAFAQALMLWKYSVFH